MNTKKLPLDAVQENRDNPRIISDTRFEKLIDNILTFPKMLEIRPVVIDKDNVSIGGNRRHAALQRIASMTKEAIIDRLGGVRDYTDMTAKQQKALVSYWATWLKNPTVTVVNGEDLTEQERTKFIFLDNVSSGDWDYAQLDKWDAELLEDWGVGVEMPEFNDNDDSNLPEELKGRNLIPDELEKLQGRDETLMQRVIINYYPDQAKAVAEMLGLDEIEKVLYRFDELK